MGSTNLKEEKEEIVSLSIFFLSLPTQLLLSVSSEKKVSFFFLSRMIRLCSIKFGVFSSELLFKIEKC